MRKLQTLLALSWCFPSMASTQTGYPTEQQLHQELSMLFRDNPITLFIDWLATPVVQNILLFLIIMCMLYCLTVIILNGLIVREVLPPDMTIFLKDLIGIEEPVAVVNREHPTPFELEQCRLQNGNAMMELGNPILATINFLEETTAETKALKRKLIGKKIEIVLSNEGNLICIE